MRFWTARSFSSSTEHGSIILTTNLGIASWGEIFEDSTVAAAILDRLLHHPTVLQIDGDSYRVRDHRARLAQLRAADHRSTRRSACDYWEPVGPRVCMR
jgi:IstB-like ATP binding protein